MLSQPVVNGVITEGAKQEKVNVANIAPAPPAKVSPLKFLPKNFIEIPIFLVSPQGPEDDILFDNLRLPGSVRIIG